MSRIWSRIISNLYRHEPSLHLTSISIRPPADLVESLLILQHIVQTADMRQDLNHKLVATVESQLGVAAPADTGRRTSDATRFVISFLIVGTSGLGQGILMGPDSQTHMVVPGGRVVPCEQ